LNASCGIALRLKVIPRFCSSSAWTYSITVTSVETLSVSMVTLGKPFPSG
jgi:hypothetical protein